MPETSSITYHSESIDFNLPNELNTSSWILNAITSEGKTLGEVAYIFCSDDYLHKINLEQLNHDTYTDIITFNYCEGDLISSDIFISIDRVKENALTYKVDFFNELHRVIIHGILHLIGYDDKSESDQVVMREKEDFYLSLPFN